MDFQDDKAKTKRLGAQRDDDSMPKQQVKMFSWFKQMISSLWCFKEFYVDYTKY